MAESVTAIWDASTEPNLAGYHLSYGTASGAYTATLDVTDGGNSAVVSNLQPGIPYYFVVTAFSNSGLESPRSAEQVYTISTPPTEETPPPTPTPLPSVTPTPSETPSSSPSASPTVSPSPSPTPSAPPASPSPTVSPSPSPHLTHKPKPTPRPHPTPKQKPGGATTGPAKTLLNVSTRVQVKSGDNVLIGGFIVTGDEPKNVAFRAIGPSMAAGGVHDSLQDPVLELYDSDGALIAHNDDWTSLPDHSIPSGLTPVSTAESVIIKRLPPGGYTAVLRGAQGATGVALFELYDLEPAQSRVSNISTRGVVEAGEGAMIAGFIIGGSEPTKVIIRAIGPSLSAGGIAGALQDPVLELRDSVGSLIFSNDNWSSQQKQQIVDSTIPPKSEKEAAIVATLDPGSYTATVRGAHNTSGVALIEVYNLESP